MKTSAALAIAFAVFVGAFGAHEAAKWYDHRSPILGLTMPPELTARNVDFHPVSGGPADFEAAAKKVLPSVVSIDKYQRVEHFFEDPTVEETASGSGVIISRDGTIITNNHVVEGATEVRVHLPDHRVLTAQVVGTDPTSDIAVIKVKAEGLSPAEMGDSDKLEVGQWVLAVGNPLGFEGTLSAGVVSNKARSLGAEGHVLVNAIQTDAAINPGNSGGALTDADGRLVGINAAISSNTGTNIGIGFAIPVNRVRRVAREIIQTGHAENPYLGLMINPRLEGWLGSESDRQELAEAAKVDLSQVPSEGYLIYSPRSEAVASGSPASRAGIQPLDVLIAIDGKPINQRLDYFDAMDGKRPGDKVSVKYWSHGQTKTVTLTLTDEPTDS